MSRFGTTDHDGHDEAMEARLASWMARQAPPNARRELLETVLDRTRAMPRRRWLRPFRGVASLPAPIGLRVAIAGLLVVALCGALVVGGRLSMADLRGTVLSPAPPSVAPSPPASPSAALVVTPVADLSTFGGATIGDVTLGGDGLLAVGSQSVGGSKAGAVWTSADGRTWTSLPTTPSLAAGVMLRVAGRGSVLVAMGTDCPPNAQQICGWGRAWTTQDGASWQAASTRFGNPGTGGVGYGFAAIIQGGPGPGYLMVGGADQADPYGGTYLGPVIATSTDGSAWTTRRLTGPGFDGASMGGVAAVGRGGPPDGAYGFVVVGSDASLAPAVWQSPDGETWRRVPTPGAPSAGELDDVAGGPGGYVAVGHDGARAAAWVSSDGLAWRAAPAAPALDDAAMTRVVWAGTAFLAMGRTGSGDGAAWVSTDGLRWTRLDTTRTFKGVPVVAGGALDSRLVLFGQDQAGHIVVAMAGG